MRSSATQAARLNGASPRFARPYRRQSKSRFFGAPVSLEDFEKDDIRRAATERAMLTISEAVRHLPSDIIDRNPDLQWDNMRGMGNRLRHEYWMIDAKIVWEVVQHDLDGLDTVIRAELARARDDEVGSLLPQGLWWDRRVPDGAGAGWACSGRWVRSCKMGERGHDGVVASGVSL